MGAREMRAVLSAILMAIWPSVAAAVDLNGKWRFESNTLVSVEIVQVTQTGNMLTIPFILPFTGTVGTPDADGFVSYGVTYSGFFQAGMGGRVNPSGNMLDGRLAALINPPFPDLAWIVATRCSCDDGNTVNGDGCDETCQVEPCWTCAGDPSVCTPTGDGGACEDGSDCTTGETCTGGLCGGGSPVSPCVDMTGIWARHREIPGQGIVSDFTSSVTQRGGDVRMGEYVGAINPATGDFNLRVTNSDLYKLFCFAFFPLSGTVAANGLTYAASGFVQEPMPSAPDHCDTFSLTEIGSHCGDGTINVVEQCDDGNLLNGDGCSALCEVEPCWMCTGVPSGCSPAPGGPCDDGNPCTAADACDGGGSCVGTPDPGVSCDDGSACTTADVCAGDGSCGGTPVDCGECHTCNPAVGCILEPSGTPCDDGGACSIDSFCQSDGTCAGNTPITCEPCFACDAALGCVARPQTICRASTIPEKSQLRLKHVDSSNDRFRWSWKKGAEILGSELGSLPAGDDVSICVYDESTATPSLLFRATAPGGPLWTAAVSGFRYRDPAAAPDGILTGLLKAGASGRAGAKLKGQGEHLTDRLYGLPSLPLPLPLRVQLHGESGLCLETRHDATTVVENDATTGVFKARGIP